MRRTMVLTEIAHVIGAHVEIEGQMDGTIEIVVVVDTDLELNMLHPKHDKPAVDKLLGDLYNHIKSNPHHVGKIRLRTMR